MKKEVFNILFLAVVVAAVAWLYWKGEDTIQNSRSSVVLALSWQPAFCERKPNKPECRSQRKERYDANNFSLHGIWPQPRNNIYCDVPKHLVELDKRGKWSELPKLELSAKTREELALVMPGYRSNLHRHEWYKHGTCMGVQFSPESYYKASIRIVQAINDKPLRDLFAKNIGKEITSAQIIKAFERSEGKDAGQRITISCKRDGKRTIINELKISYALPEGDVVSSFDELQKLAPKLPIGCKRGIVDPVGLQ